MRTARYAIIFLLAAAGCMTRDTPMSTTADLPASPLTLTLKKSAFRRHWKRDAPLKVTFQNVSNKPIRILDMFEPVPVFFSFQVTQADGVPIVNVPGAGNMDPFGSLNYITLKPNEKFTTTVRLDQVLPEVFQPGDYKLSVIYKNQYGENCFTGRLTSNPIKLKIHPGDPSK